MNTVSKILFVLGIILLCYITVKDSHSNNIVKNEIYRVVHSTTIDTINDIQKNLPYIFKSVTAKSRNIADRKYKCKLLEDTAILDDC